MIKTKKLINAAEKLVRALITWALNKFFLFFLILFFFLLFFSHHLFNLALAFLFNADDDEVINNDNDDEINTEDDADEITADNDNEILRV